MMEHTPGTWKCNEIEVWAEEPGNLARTGIAHMSGIDPKTNKANARLIASAPDLLNAAKAACVEGKTGQAVLAQLSSAVSKAEGN